MAGLHEQMDRRKVLRLGAGAALWLGEQYVKSRYGAVKAQDGFVRANGTRFEVDGQDMGMVMGVNRYDLAGGNSGVCGGFLEGDLDGYFGELENMGVRLMRTWLYPNQTANGTNFDFFNRVLDAAGNHGVYVMPGLEDHWAHCGRGQKNDAWYGGGYMQPQGGDTISHYDYVQLVGDRFKNDTRIFGWDMINEPEGQHDKLYGYAASMAGALAEVDPNHLRTIGMIGGGQNGASFEEYKRIYGINELTMGSYHWYRNNTQDQWNGWRLRVQQMRALGQMGKPLGFFEVGINVPDEVGTKEARAAEFDTLFGDIEDAGVAAAAIWSYRNRTGGSDQYAFGPNDPEATVVRKYAGVDVNPTATVMETPTPRSTNTEVSPTATVRPTDTARPTSTPTPRGTASATPTEVMPTPTGGVVVPTKTSVVPPTPTSVSPGSETQILLPIIRR